MFACFADFVMTTFCLTPAFQGLYVCVQSCAVPLVYNELDHAF